MTLTLTLTAEQEARLKAEAQESGLPMSEYALRRLFGHSERPTASSGQRHLSARELLAMSPEERGTYLRAAADAAAPIYEADLALPYAERELTALTALDGEPFLELE